jgi:uncharacterized membrane protein YkoI
MKSRLTSIAFIIVALSVLSTPALLQAQSTQASKPPAQDKMHQEKSKTEKDAQKAKEQAALAKEAKIALEQARATALKRAPGKVESSELEREHGKLVYSFDIRTGKDITEVQVSAIDGKIVSVEHETPEKEASEKKKEEIEKARPPQKK